jgi:hypothetical protein
MGLPVAMRPPVPEINAKLLMDERDCADNQLAAAVSALTNHDWQTPRKV